MRFYRRGISETTAILTTILAVVVVGMAIGLAFTYQNSPGVKNATTSTVTLTSTTIVVTNCRTTTLSQQYNNPNLLTQNPFYMNNIHGIYPNGTNWISITGKIFNNYTMITSGETPISGSNGVGVTGLFVLSYCNGGN